MDDCGALPCLHSGTCEDQVDGFFCLCADGYQGALCDVNTDDCAENPCLNGGTCADAVNGYNCTCVAGYTGNSCGIGMCITLEVIYTTRNVTLLLSSRKRRVLEWTDWSNY